MSFQVYVIFEFKPCTILHFRSRMNEAKKLSDEDLELARKAMATKPFYVLTKSQPDIQQADRKRKYHAAGILTEVTINCLQ